MKTILFDPWKFKKIKTLEFKDSTFTFPNNEALGSFMFNDLFKRPNLVSNLSIIKMSKETDYQTI